MNFLKLYTIIFAIIDIAVVAFCLIQYKIEMDKALESENTL